MIHLFFKYLGLTLIKFLRPIIGEDKNSTIWTLRCLNKTAFHFPIKIYTPKYHASEKFPFVLCEKTFLFFDFHSSYVFHECCAQKKIIKFVSKLSLSADVFLKCFSIPERKFTFQGTLFCCKEFSNVFPSGTIYGKCIWWKHRSSW